MKYLNATILFCLFSLICQAQNNSIMLGYGKGRTPVINEIGRSFDLTYQRMMTTHSGARINIGTYGAKYFVFIPVNDSYNDLDVVQEKERFSYIDIDVFVAARKSKKKLNAYFGGGITFFQSNYTLYNGYTSIQFAHLFDTQDFDSIDKNRIRSTMVNYFFSISYKPIKQTYIEFVFQERRQLPFSDPIGHTITRTVNSGNVSFIDNLPIGNTANYALRIGYNF
jgi:hypothetical protein